METVNTHTLPKMRIIDIQGNPAAVLRPMDISHYSALSIPAYWRAVNFLADNLASFPRSVQKDGARRTPDQRPHPLERLLSRRPNQLQNSFIFWRTLFLHAAHTGNGFAEIQRGARFEPMALHNRLPEDVAPFRFDHGQGQQQYYYIREGARIVPAADMIHLQALGWDGQSGADPVALHAETFQRASAIGRYQVKYLQQGTVIRGAIEIPAGVSDDQVAQIVDTLRGYFRGPDAERDVIVLSDGARLNNATLSPQESQLVEQSTSTTKAIAQITGVPPQFLYEFSESKYNNSIEQMGQDVVRYTFRPWIEQAEDELTIKLLTDGEQDDGYRIRLNPDALLRGDTKTQVQTIVETVKAGLRTRNEGRDMLELPRDPDPESEKLKTLGDTAPAAGV
jgi:HK97 family phage portal protein